MYKETEKVYLPEKIPSLISNLRKKGKTLVFTNGCFDILHIGHVRYLQKARDLGDFLIVGINSDQSIRGIKGENRPIIPQEQRAELLEALECTDLIVIFDEPDPLQLISLIQPDILVKGADWGTDQIIGREIVEQKGGQVIRLPLIPSVSTSLIIDTIVSRFAKK